MISTKNQLFPAGLRSVPDKLVHLLLLVVAQLAGTAVNEKQETANDGKDLEEVVFGKVLVGVVLVKLWR